MEAVCLIQTSPGDQGITNASVYLDIPETNARLTSMSANHIHAFEVFYIRFQCYVHRQHFGSSLDMPSFDMLCNLAHIKMLTERILLRSN